MTEIENTQLAHLLSGEDFVITLFIKDGAGSRKIPVEIDAAEDRLKVYYSHEQYMQIFYQWIHHLQYESINFRMQIVKFRYQNQSPGLQLVSR